MKFGVCRLRLCGGESPVCTFEEESAGANQGDQQPARGRAQSSLYGFSLKIQRNDPLRRRATGGGDEGGTEWREGPAVAEQVFEVRVTAGPQ